MRKLLKKGALLLLAVCLLSTLGIAVDYNIGNGSCELCPWVRITAENTTEQIGNTVYYAELPVEPITKNASAFPGKIIVAPNRSQAYDLPETLPIEIKNQLVKPGYGEFHYLDWSVELRNLPLGMAVNIDLAYFQNETPSLKDMANAVAGTFAFIAGQEPSSPREVAFAGKYLALVEDITNPFTGQPGYLVQVKITRNAYLCILADKASYDKINDERTFAAGVYHRPS